MFGNKSFVDHNFVVEVNDVIGEITEPMVVRECRQDGRLRDARPRPSSLLLSPTALPLASSFDMTLAVRSFKGPTYTTFRPISDPLPGARQVEDPEWVIKHRLKVNELRANLSSAVAEWNKTHVGFADLGKKALTILKRMRKGWPKGSRPPNASKGKPLGLGDIADTHLALHFGIKPIIQDLGALVRSLESNDHFKPIRVRSSSYTDKVYVYPDSDVIVTTNQRVSLSVVSYWLADTGNLGKLDLGNPVIWAWELIPFSFVLDYFISVGDYLTALSPMAGLNRHGPVVVTRRVRGASDIRVQPSSGYKLHKPGSVKFVSHQRFVYHELPLPVRPTVKVTKSTLAVQHLLALFVKQRQRYQTKGNYSG